MSICFLQLDWQQQQQQLSSSQQLPIQQQNGNLPGKIASFDHKHNLSEPMKYIIKKIYVCIIK